MIDQLDALLLSVYHYFIQMRGANLLSLDDQVALCAWVLEKYLNSEQMLGLICLPIELSDVSGVQAFDPLDVNVSQVQEVLSLERWDLVLIEM